MILALDLVATLAGTVSAQAIELRVELGKSVFFEDEPIYVVYELRNPGVDTVWVDLFGLPYRNLTVQLNRGGNSLPEDLYVADYFHGTSWRGVPIPPSGTLHETAVLQDWWGTRDEASRGVFLHRLGTGVYDLTARYVSNLHAEGPIEAEVGPIRFEVRQRTAEEEMSFREFARVRRIAWDPSKRGRYLGEVISLVETRLAANPADPYLAFLLRNGIQTALAVGQQPDSSTAGRIVRLRIAVAEAQKSVPAGAAVVDAVLSDSPDLAAVLSERLQGSLAGQVASERAERHLPF